MKRIRIILTVIILVAYLFPTGLALAEGRQLTLIEEREMAFFEQPLWGAVEVIPLPNDTLLFKYFSLNTIGWAESPFYAPYNERLEILDMDGNAVWSSLFLHLSEEEVEAANYLLQFAVDSDRFTIEYYPDLEMNSYSWNIRALSGDGIDYSMTAVQQSDDQIRYIENHYPFRVEAYRHPDEQGNPRCIITYLPTGDDVNGVASNHIVSYRDRLFMAYINEEQRYALNIYDAQCQLTGQILLPFSGMGALDTPKQDLIELLVNDETILFFTKDDENARRYWLHIYDRTTDTFADPVAVYGGGQYIVPLAISGEGAIVSVQSAFPTEVVLAADHDGGPHDRLYYLDAEGTLTPLEDLEGQIIWHRTNDEKGQITLLLRDLSDETYSLRTYAISQESYISTSSNPSRKSS